MVAGVHGGCDNGVCGDASCDLPGGGQQCELLNFLVVFARGLVPWTAHHVPHPTVALEFGGHSLLLVPGPVCRLHCLEVLAEGALVGVLDVSEVVGEFLVREEVFDDRKQLM